MKYYDSMQTLIRALGAEIVNTPRELAKKEGIFAGSSSGAALAASLKLAEETGEGNIVTVFPDRGDRYFSSDLYGLKQE